MKQYSKSELRHDLCTWGYFTRIKKRLVRVCGLNHDNYEYPICDQCPHYVHWQRFIEERVK